MERGAGGRATGSAVVVEGTSGADPAAHGRVRREPAGPEMVEQLALARRTVAQGWALRRRGTAATGAGGSPACAFRTARKSSDVVVDLATVFQTIRGFGGASIAGFIPDLTTAQVEDAAFGNGPGQIGTVRSHDPGTAAGPHEVQRGGYDSARTSRRDRHRDALDAARGSEVGITTVVDGQLNTASYCGVHAAHLLSFRDFMASNGAPLYAISVQNEPDITVTYESCYLDGGPTSVSWLSSNGAKFGATQVMAAESFHFDHTLTDPDPEQQRRSTDGWHHRGPHFLVMASPTIPSPEAKRKEVWMT